MPTMTEREETTTIRTWFAEWGGSLVLHVMLIGTVLGSGLIFRHKSDAWGDQSLQASSIQATAVSAIPLPPKQPVNEENVLATETPSPAPIETKETAEVAPSPKDIPVVVKKPEKTKIAEKPTPAVQRPQVTKPTERAATGEAGGVRVAMTTAENNVGTSAVAFTDAGFGVRFAYYARQMAQKTEQQWYTGLLTKAAYGRKAAISFRVDRDGTPNEFRIEQASGDPMLDQSGLRALQRIDTFGPLPDAYQGSYLVVHYTFEPKSAH